MRIAKRATDKNVLMGLVLVAVPGSIPVTAAYLLYKKLRRKHVRTNDSSSE